MARESNHKVERRERQRAKAAKKATRLEAKKEKADKRGVDDTGIEPADGTVADDSAGLPLAGDDPNR